MSGQGRLPIGRIALAKTLAVDWVSEHSKIVLASLATVLILLFCLFQLTGRFEAQKKSDYLAAQTAYSAWISAAASDGVLFKDLEKPLNRHPELQAKFGALIAQHCLALEDSKKGMSYAARSLKRTEHLLSPYYTQFSQNSLRIVNGKYIEALNSAKELKSAMEKDLAFWESRDKMIRSGHLLYAYNLLRIASLEREAGTNEGELLAWNELFKNAGWSGVPSSSSKTYDPEAYLALARTFQDGEVSLMEFVQQRKRELEAG
jgi:hypothetical protein